MNDCCPVRKLVCHIFLWREIFYLTKIYDFFFQIKFIKQVKVICSLIILAGFCSIIKLKKKYISYCFNVNLKLICCLNFDFVSYMYVFVAVMFYMHMFLLHGSPVLVHVIDLTCYLICTLLYNGSRSHNITKLWK